jgi:hypothetical protein
MLFLPLWRPTKAHHDGSVTHGIPIQPGKEGNFDSAMGVGVFTPTEVPHRAWQSTGV